MSSFIGADGLVVPSGIQLPSYGIHAPIRILPALNLPFPALSPPLPIFLVIPKQPAAWGYSENCEPGDCAIRPYRWADRTRRAGEEAVEGAEVGGDRTTCGAERRQSVSSARVHHLT